MGLNAAMQKAEEEANALILETQNNSTPGQGNTEGSETPLQQHAEQGTPKEGEYATTSKDSEQMFEAKYKVLQGKYNAEVPQLRDEANQLRDEVKSLKQQLQQSPAPVDVTKYQTEIDDLKRQLEAKGQQDIGSQDVDDYISQEYGSELANAIRSMINKSNSGGNDVAQLRQTFEETQQSMKMQSISQMLESQGIDFNQVDSDPLFHEWLAQEEGQTGQSRQTFLSQHFEQGNIAKTAAFYTAFKAHERTSYKENPLAQHVDVSRNNSSPDSGTEPDVWTVDDVNRLYDDYSKGKLPEAKFQELEQQLFRAQAEGNFRS